MAEKFPPFPQKSQEKCFNLTIKGQDFNNTNHQLIVDGIKYSTTISSNDYSNITIAVIPPYSSINLNKKVDYFFTYPPGTISVKNSHSETRYWLHRDLTQP